MISACSAPAFLIVMRIDPISLTDTPNWFSAFTNFSSVGPELNKLNRPFSSRTFTFVCAVTTGSNAFAPPSVVLPGVLPAA